MKRLLSRNTFFALLALACLATVQQRPMGRYQITVTPDHADWKYVLGEVLEVRGTGYATPKLSWPTCGLFLRARF